MVCSDYRLYRRLGISVHIPSPRPLEETQEKDGTSSGESFRRFDLAAPAIGQETTYVPAIEPYRSCQSASNDGVTAEPVNA